MPGDSRDGVSVIAGARTRISSVDLCLEDSYNRPRAAQACFKLQATTGFINHSQQHDDIGQGEFLNHLGVRVLSQHMLHSLVPRLLFPVSTKNAVWE